ncbi:SCO2322 family protein [Streptomyces sp. NPDC006012]|uniref:SCO2322 family protein n=1 Tax=Streptomyces sp. NPDC006012 TaxID=3364739 RepID=UPI0036A84485
MTGPRRGVLLLLAALLLWGGTGQAQAAGYRYWSFWDRTGDRWTYATEGPSLARPADGAVQGFRFAVSEDSADATYPRGTTRFAEICAHTPARDGRKRVALVIDFGTAADAPAAEAPPTARTACAVLAPDATTAEALAAVAGPLRYDSNALLCAIAGYPKKGCGEQVAARDGKPTAAAKRPAAGEDDGNGPSLGLWAGGAAVVLLGTAAVWQARRRRDA